MTEKDSFITKIQELRQIKPSQAWVSSTKSQILGKDEPNFLFFPYFKPAFAGLIAIFIIFGTFGFGQSSLPGDILYPLKKTVEKGRSFFIASDEKSAFQLKLANDRLEDLTKAPVRNLAPTISEFEASIYEASKNLVKFDITTSTPAVIQQLAQETKKLEENKQKVESLGVVIGDEGTQGLDNALKKVVEILIKDLEERSLTEEKEQILNGMKEFFENDQCSEALELYLINQ